MSQYFMALQRINKCSVPFVSNLNRVWRIHMQCYSSPLVRVVGLGFQKCGHPSVDHFAQQQCNVSTEEPTPEHGCNLNYEEVCKLKDKGEIILIDVRDPFELQEVGKLPDSINIPLKELPFALQELSDKEFKLKYGVPKPTANDPIVFSCAAGVRSKTALDVATKMGFKKACHYQGGFKDWMKNVREVKQDK